MSNSNDLVYYEDKQRKIVKSIKTLKICRFVFLLLSFLSSAISLIFLVYAIIYRYNDVLKSEKIATPCTLIFAIFLFLFVIGLLLFCAFNASIDDKNKEIHKIDESIDKISKNIN